MARALVTDIGRKQVDNGVTFLNVEIFYAGVDVPGNSQEKSILVSLAGVTDATTLATAIAAAVRTCATSNGYTVGANLVFQPTFSAT